MCISYTPQSVVYKGYGDLSRAKASIVFLSKVKDKANGNLVENTDKKRELILAFSEARVIFSSSNDDNADFIFPNNKEHFYTNSLNDYISKMRSNSCRQRSLSELNVFRI
jgi:hypothetical protein